MRSAERPQREETCCGDDGLEIGDESLANATGGQVKPSIFGKLLKSLGFEYEFNS